MCSQARPSLRYVLIVAMSSLARYTVGLWSGKVQLEARFKFLVWSGKAQFETRLAN